jgi:hypothetical protein
MGDKCAMSLCCVMYAGTQARVLLAGPLAVSTPKLGMCTQSPCTEPHIVLPHVAVHDLPYEKLASCFDECIDVQCKRASACDVV